MTTLKPKDTIGRAERVDFPELGITEVPARIDSGARTSALWATNIQENNGILSFVLFSEASEKYTGNTIETERYSLRAVANSSGTIEERYTVRLLIAVHGRKIRAAFTLANRAEQVYPVLVGRNVLHGKFLVDVQHGQPLIQAERAREDSKWAYIRKSKGEEGL